MLWFTTFRCTRRAMNGVDWRNLNRAPDFWDVSWAGVGWGGLNGVTILFALSIAFAVLAIISGSTIDDLAPMIGLNIMLFMAMPVLWFFGFVVGAVAGALLGMVDVWVVDASAIVFQAYARRGSEPEHDA
jgi:hypothetical protein